MRHAADFTQPNHFHPSITWAVATQIFFIFTPKIGEDEPNFDEHIFQRGWNHQLVTLPETHRSSSHLLKWDFWKGILYPELRRIQVKDF